MADLLLTFIDLSGAYFFGNLPIIINNFTLVIIAIIILSIMPGVIEYFRRRRETARCRANSYKSLTGVQNRSGFFEEAT